MSASRLSRLERAVLRNVDWQRLCCDGRTEAGKIGTIQGCYRALERLRRYGFVHCDYYLLTEAGRALLGAS